MKSTIIKKILERKKEIEGFPRFAGKQEIINNYSGTIEKINLYKLPQKAIRLLANEREREYEFVLKKAAEIEEKKEAIKQSKNIFYKKKNKNG